MKYIKQKSTNKIVHREIPHSDQTISNAVDATGIDESDLEVVEEDLSSDEWNAKTFAQESWTFKRKAKYPTIEELVVALYDDDDKAAIEKRRADVKAKYPKP